MLRITNIDEISKIKIIPNPINTRIKRECQKMKDNYDEIIIEYTDNGIILITFKKMCNTYKFNIPRHYPFISPRLSVNDMEQNLFFNLKTTRFKTILRSDIEKMEVITYRPIIDYGGWGVRFGRKGMAYNVSGNIGLLISRKNGKTILIGTQKPDEMKEKLEGKRD